MLIAISVGSCRLLACCPNVCSKQEQPSLEAAFDAPGSCVGGANRALRPRPCALWQMTLVGFDEGCVATEKSRGATPLPLWYLTSSSVDVHVEPCWDDAVPL